LREDRVDFRRELVFGDALGDRELFDQEATRGVEHLALAERKLLGRAKHAEITQDLGDLEHRAGLDLLHVLAIAAIPRLGVARDIASLEDRKDFFDLLRRDQVA
jgi:hypothetical protein